MFFRRKVIIKIGEPIYDLSNLTIEEISNFVREKVKNLIEEEQWINEVIVDYDETYEKNSIFREFLNLFIIPIINNLPTKLFLKTTKKAQEVHQHATTYKALEIVYTFDNKINFNEGILKGLLLSFFQKTNNAKALRNRLRLVKKKIKESIDYFLSKNKKEIQILSLASGSNKAVLETVSILKDKANFKIFSVDKHLDAIEYSKSLAKSLNIYDFCEWYQDTISNFLKICKENNKKFDIIEMVGFLDYVEKDKAIYLFNEIFDILENDGFFICGNIKDNKERKFITEVIKWPGLIFRDEYDLLKILKNSKFKNSRYKIIYEPLKIHGIIFAYKHGG